MRDNKYLTKIIAGCLLGDASISIDSRDNGKGNAVFETTQIVDHLDYLEYLQNILQDITTFSVKKSKDALDSHWVVDRYCKRKEQWRLRSSRHPFFNSFRERHYIEGKKVVDPHYLKLLDWEMLSLWYMDDGYLLKTHCTNPQGKIYPTNALALCTQGFSYGDHLLLKRAIKETLDIDFNVKQERNQLGNIKYRLHLARKDIAKFVYNIEKYIVPSFAYKVELTQMLRLKEYENISRMESSEKSDEDIV